MFSSYVFISNELGYGAKLSYYLSQTFGEYKENNLYIKITMQNGPTLIIKWIPFIRIYDVKTWRISKQNYSTLHVRLNENYYIYVKCVWFT